MKVVICEDEQIVAQEIKKKLTDKYPDMNIDVFNSGEDLISVFEKQSGEGRKASSASARSDTFADILILDVMMPGIDGFQVAKHLRDANDKSIIIFLTGNEQQVYEAFKVEAFRYLLKPVNDVNLYEAIDAACEKINSEKVAGDDSIFIHFGGTLTRINRADIISAEIYNRKITINTVHGVYDYYGKITELLENLGGDFYSPHRSYIINLNFVESYNSHEIKLRGGGSAILSKKKYNDFVRTYARFIRR